MKNLGRILLRGALIAAVSLIVGLSIYSWNARNLVGNEMPMPFGIGVAVVLSGSMEPALQVNDVVIVREAPEYRVGDVVVYQAHSLIIHRIIQIDGDTVITQGDANNIQDDPIRVDQIKGRMASRIPFLGLVIKAVKSLPGILLMLLAAFWLLHRSWQSEKQEKTSELDRLKDEITRLKAEEEAEAENSITDPTETNHHS